MLLFALGNPFFFFFLFGNVRSINAVLVNLIFSVVQRLQCYANPNFASVFTVNYVIVTCCFKIVNSSYSFF